MLTTWTFSFGCQEYIGGRYINDNWKASKSDSEGWLQRDAVFVPKVNRVGNDGSDNIWLLTTSLTSMSHRNDNVFSNRNM